MRDTLIYINILVTFMRGPICVCDSTRVCVPNIYVTDKPKEDREDRDKRITKEMDQRRKAAAT